MTVRSVHWHEGMSLWPHHMQQAERFIAQEIRRNSAWDTHYNWGLRAVELDLDALGNSRFEVKALTARFRDGTVIAVPDDTDLPGLDLKEALEAHESLTVSLAISHTRPGKPNVAEAPTAGASTPQAPNEQLDARYWIESRE